MILALHNNDSGSSSFFLFKVGGATCASPSDSCLKQFGMTGSFKYMARGKAVHKHAHVIMKDREGGHLCFVDSRRFGSWAPCKSMDDWGADRGPDPVDEFEEFCKNVALKVTPKSKFWNKPICEVLLLQEVFNGIGNSYFSSLLIFFFLLFPHKVITCGAKCCTRPECLIPFAKRVWCLQI